jgi:hypothetical protein
MSAASAQIARIYGLLRREVNVLHSFNRMLYCEVSNGAIFSCWLLKLIDIYTIWNPSRKER